MMLYFLCGWLIRSFLLILAGTLLLRLLHVKNPSFRLTVCGALLAVSLMLPALMVALPAFNFPITAGHQPVSMTTLLASFPAARALDAQPADGPLGMAIPAPPASRHHPFAIGWIAFALLAYAFVAVALLLRIAFGLVYSRRILRASRPSGIASPDWDIRESDQVRTPLTTGILRRAILLPGDWREWTPMNLTAVLAHERSHLERRDVSLQCLSLVHRALLWASPMSWHLHRQIVRAGEQISDDAAIGATGNRVAYAEMLLAFLQREPAPTGAVGVKRLAPQGVPMAGYEPPQRRIRRILNSRALPTALTPRRIAAALVLVAPLAYAAAATRPGTVRSQSSDRPAFDADSVKPSSSGRMQYVRPLPGRLNADATLRTLTQVAYGLQPFQLTGGPESAMSARYQITATAGSDDNREQLLLMLQTLLTDRFRLAVHYESKEMPVYALVAINGGLKLPPPADGACVDSAAEASPAWTGGGRMATAGELPTLTTRCGSAGIALVPAGARLQGGGIAMAEFARILSTLVGKSVIDKTGFQGHFDLKLDFLPDGNTPGMPPPPPGANVSGPSLPQALRQLGLRLESTKGPVRVLVVDHAELPSGN